MRKDDLRKLPSAVFFLLATAWAGVGHAQGTNSPAQTSVSTNAAPVQAAVDPVVELSEANRFYEQKQFDAALIKVNEVIKAAPDNGEAYVLRGAIYANEKLWDQAKSDYGNALQIDDKDVHAKFDLAELDFAQKNYDAARPGFEALEKDFILGDLALYKVFLCDLFAGHDDVAAKEFDAFNKVGENASYYFANVAWFLYHQKPEDARTWLASADNIYAPSKCQFYKKSLIDLGYLPLPPSLKP